MPWNPIYHKAEGPESGNALSSVECVTLLCHSCCPGFL